MRIDLFTHFYTQELGQAYLSIPLGAKGRRLDPIAIRTFVQAQRTTDIDVLWDMEQRLTVLDRYGTALTLTLSRRERGLNGPHRIRAAPAGPRHLIGLSAGGSGRPGRGAGGSS